MTDHPDTESAPGLVWRPLKRGWQALWRARKDLVKRGWKPRNFRIWSGEYPNEQDLIYIGEKCHMMQEDMLVWGRGDILEAGLYDGTIKGLIVCYQTDPDSAYQKLRYKTRENYGSLLNILENGRKGERDKVPGHGDQVVADIKARNVLRWHEEWSAGGRTAIGHSMVGMLRTLVGFGTTILDDKGCRAVKALLHDMRFKMAPARQERITAEQVVAVRAQAHKMGLHSVALAQALQFELMLRQKDVIGEWVPTSEPEISDVLNGNEKWLRGLRWSEVDQNLILRHTTSKRNKEIEVDLRLYPMVMEELVSFADKLPASGPVIIAEATGRPYVTHVFRRVWRQVARAAGVPDAVYNMDSRAGAISEATDAGADLEHVRHAATHSNISMTQRYSRGARGKVDNVARLRVKHRNKPGTSET